jgi:hypothetical protein
MFRRQKKEAIKESNFVSQDSPIIQNTKIVFNIAILILSKLFFMLLR